MKPRALLVFCMGMFGFALAGAEIGIGDAREDVLRQLGKPASIARRGEHEIFLYPKGGRIEFVGGKVTDVKGPLPPVIAAATVAPADGAAPAAPPPGPKAGPQNSAPLRGAAKPAPPRTAPTDEYNPAVAANELAKHVDRMDTPWGAGPAREVVHSPLDSVPSFLTGLLLRFMFTIIALKLAFKYWEMDAFWKGIFLIAGIDMGLHGIFQLLGPATGGFTTMAAVENGIPFLVLIYTIHRFCFNKRIQNAVLTAAAVKLVVTLCYIFAGVGALNVIFG